MKWYDETAYDEKTGEGTIAFLDEERLWVQPGDEILLHCDVTGFWAPAIVASNDGGNIEAYWPEHTSSGVVPPDFLARTTRLPKGFLIPNTYHLQHYSAQLLAREQNNGNVHPPPSKHTSDYQKFFLVYVVILLHGEFAGQDVPHRSLKHRAVNDLLPALPMECLALHEHSVDSTQDGMWVKYLERNIGDLRHIKGQLEKFKGYEKLADVVPRKTIRWVGSEEAYQAILYEFRSYIALFPKFKSYHNHKGEPPPQIKKEESVLELEMNENFNQQLTDLVQKVAQQNKAITELKERHERETAELKREIKILKEEAAPPPDQSGEFKADLKAIIETEPGRLWMTVEVKDLVAAKWESKTHLLGFLQIDNRKHPRKNFRDIVYAALTELEQAGEIQHFRMPSPTAEPDAARKNDWYWAAKKRS